MVTLLRMTIAAAPKLETHPPLARDAAGNMLRVPAETNAFALARETTGRPRLLRNPDKQLLRFPLHTSPDDIVELCGAGVYRVYALDALGEQLGDEHVARWDLMTSSSREPRNASIDPTIALRAERSATVAAPSSDLRFALETMAQMMRTNSDALRLVAESQVDLAKTIASVKGLPRNAAMFLPQTPPANASTAEDEDDEVDEEADHETQPAPTNYLDLLMPFSEALAGKVADMVPGLIAGAGAKPDAATAETSPSVDLANRPFEARELVDLRYAHRKAEAKRNASQQPSVPLQARVMKDPQLVRQIMAIKALLAPEEIETLLAAASTWSDAAQTKFLETIKPIPASDAVVYCREVIKTVLAHQADQDGAQ